MAHTWKPVHGHPDYDVNEVGQIRSRKRPGVPRLLRPGPHPGGYSQYVLDGKNVRAHVAVLEAFVCPRPSGRILARHIDDDSTNNTLGNLEWGTELENRMDSISNGTWSNQNVEKQECPQGHAYDEANTYFHVNPKTGWKNRQCRKCKNKKQRDRRRA